MNTITVTSHTEAEHLRKWKISSYNMYKAENEMDVSGEEMHSSIATSDDEDENTRAKSLIDDIIEETESDSF